MGSSSHNSNWCEKLSELIFDDDDENTAIVQQMQSDAVVVASMIPAFNALSVPKWDGSVDGREYTNRDCVGAHERLVADYFVDRPTYKAAPGLVKMTAAIQMLAYGCPADSMDHWIKLAESTARESLHHFCNVVVNCFEEQYLRSLTEEDVTRLFAVGEERSWPGMLGSLNCIHWVWKNCPTAWHGTHLGHTRKATVILEAVVDQELWFWHAYFGMAGSCNDLNVLDNSHLFDNLVKGTTPTCVYQVNNNPYNMGYYLADGIYRPWATLIQTIPFHATPMDTNFAKAQEAARKYVERGFGVLQARFAIVSRPARQWDRGALSRIMKTCIILHNMIVENEHNVQLPKWKPPSNERLRHEVEM